jgi:4-hydroxy-tetrahydrodipicolinate reductase
MAVTAASLIPVPVVVLGAKGRLGQEMLRAIEADARVELVAALGRENEGFLPGLLHRDVVVMDARAAGGTADTARMCAQHRAGLLVATTGLDEAAREALAQASTSSAVMIAANLSVSAHVMAHMVKQCASLMPSTDIEIIETHHRHKRDAPSGTALMLAAAAQQARPSSALLAGRNGTSPRKPADISIAAIRGGDVVGEHEVRFLGDAEHVHLLHRVTDRAVFGRGAVVAACFLARQPAGTYHMADVVTASLVKPQ